MNFALIRIKSTLAVALGLCGLCTALSAQEMKPGLWEMKLTNKMSKNDLVAFQQMQKALASMPPEQRSAAMGRMNASGAVIDERAGTMTVTNAMCITKDSAIADRKPAGVPAGCDVKTSKSGNTVSSTWNCPQQKLTGTQLMTFESNERFSGKIVMQNASLPSGAGNQEMNTLAVWKASDCGKVKPIAAMAGK